jgi:hypothetical protein
MPRDHIAERLLASVTTPDRAQSILGDLRESAATRGELWLWASVLRTAASLSWRGVVDDRRAMFVLALRAWLLSLGLSSLAILTGSLLGGLLVGALAMRNSSFAISAFGSAAWRALFIALTSVGQFLVGRWIGRRSPSREISACLAFTMLQGALQCPVVLVNGATWELALYFLTHGFCFLGALSVRRHAIKT